MQIQMNRLKVLFIPAFNPTRWLKNKIGKQMGQYQFYEPGDVHAMIRLG
jgi:hypothetical protein